MKYVKTFESYTTNDDDRFDEWWVNGGQDIATREFEKQAEENIKDDLDKRVKEFYGENSIGDETAENNVFWYEVERLAKVNKLHLRGEKDV